MCAGVLFTGGYSPTFTHEIMGQIEVAHELSSFEFLAFIDYTLLLPHVRNRTTFGNERAARPRNQIADINGRPT